MEENNNQEGVVSGTQNASSDNNTSTDTSVPAQVQAADNTPEVLIVEETVVEIKTAEPASQQPIAGAAPEKTAEDAIQPAEMKAEPLPSVGEAEEKGGIFWKVFTIVIIILVVFLLVKVFGNKESGFDVLDTIANVNVKVSNEQEQGKVNIVKEDTRKLNEQVSEQAANQPQLTTTPATGLASASTTKIIAFYPNSIKNPGAADCRIVFPLERIAEKKYDSTVINTVRGMLSTLTAAEKNLGFTTNIPAGTMLKTVKITDKGVAEVNFTAGLNRIGGSCAVSAARAQIEQTMKQFPQVKSVLICVDGNCKQDEILQP